MTIGSRNRGASMPDNKVGITTTETGVRLYHALEVGLGVSGSSAGNVLVQRVTGLLAAGVFKWDRFLRTRGNHQLVYKTQLG